MPVLSSSIHAATGMDGPLSYAMIQTAVNESVPEDERLDWKHALPGDADEFAKDVAAMANTRGGLLVFGVAEERGTGRASALTRVDISERHQRQLRAWIGTRIAPRIAGIELHAFPAEERNREGVLVVSVPESPDMPHLIGTENHLGVPYRMGAQTFWMREWDLERAYQERFAHRASEEQRLAEIIDHVGDQLDLAHGCWLIGVTRPAITIPRVEPSPNRAVAVQTLQRALELGAQLCPTCDRRVKVVRSLDNDALSPRVGLRCWIAANRAATGGAGQSDAVHVELHDDGSVVLAARVEGWLPASVEGKHGVPDFMVTGLAVDLVALSAAVAEMRGLTGRCLVRVDALRGDEAPFAFLAPDRSGGMGQPRWTRDVRRFRPVDLVMELDADEEAHRELMRTVARDVTAQFGFDAESLAW